MDDGQRVIARQGERERGDCITNFSSASASAGWLVEERGEERKEAAKDDKRWLAGMFDYKVASRKQIAPVAWRRYSDRMLEWS